jgi:hypothetical protein
MGFVVVGKQVLKVGHIPQKLSAKVRAENRMRNKRGGAKHFA